MLAKAPHHRVIEGLKWARPCQRPACIPRGRARGVKALGLSYEKRVGEALEARIRALTGQKDVSKHLKRGQWFEFEDAKGHGWCQVDVVYLSTELKKFVVLECKLTDVAQAEAQLRELYIPVVGNCVKPALSALGVIVVRHVDRSLRLPRICTSLREAVACAQAGPSVLHWIGRGPL